MADKEDQCVGFVSVAFPEITVKGSRVSEVSLMLVTCKFAEEAGALSFCLGMVDAELSCLAMEHAEQAAQHFVAVDAQAVMLVFAGYPHFYPSNVFCSFF